MKSAVFLCFVLIVSSVTVAGENPLYAPSWGYNNNRIAISADGNSEPDNSHKWPTGDPDDWGATPAALAILVKLQMQDKLVHYSYNNFIDAPAGPDEKNQMKIGVDGAVQRWGFDEKLFFDVAKNPAAARNHLKKELTKSTAEDRLYFIHMGPAEFFYQVVTEVVDEGHGDALAHVYIVSHSGYNDTHLRRNTHHTIPQAIEYSKNQLKYKRIKDQNGDWDPNVLWNSKADFSPWYWLRDHSDPNMKWLYQRIQAHAYGKADISDAGMVYWLLLGDEDGSPSKFKRFIGDGIKSDGPIDPAPVNPQTSAVEMVPFVIPADVSADSEIAMDFQPLTEQDRLSATEHFVTSDGQRVRLWGVNLSFSANFPTHQDAERIAKRMAAFGVNTVRFHHMDTANWPRGIWDKTGRDLHPEALDRLDYFIDQLAKHGIYTNINLHVGKAHSLTLGLPKAIRNFDKVITLFTPELIDAQKDYARKLLTHKNKYRDNVTYAADYAVAIVEITNENSFFMWDGEKTLRTLPKFYADILQDQYNAWLKDKFGTTEKLEAAWNKNVEPMGNENLLQSSIPDKDWRLEQHEDAKAEIPVLQAMDEFLGLKIKITNSDGTGWHLQYNHPDLTFEQGRYYTVFFKARAAADREMDVNIGQAHEPWGNLGLSRTIELTPQWKGFTLGFFATQSDDNGRLNFAFGDSDIDIEFGFVELHTGGQVLLLPDESIEKSSVKLFTERQAKARSLDRMAFGAETEKAYFDGMYQHIKYDLGCRAMVTGTIVFGPLGLYAQSDMDFIDGHAYWQHPHFPNPPWDSGDWQINHKAMSDYPDESTLYKLAAQRLADKPYTVSEYNHPAPLDSQAECVPMIASFAAAQGWDGVWLYTYSHSCDEWDRQHLNSYFDIDTNPAKWGFMLSGRKIFDGGIFCNTHYFESLTTTEEPLLETLAQTHLQHGSNIATTLSKPVREYPVLFRHLQADKRVDKMVFRCPSRGGVQWDTDEHDKGLYQSFGSGFCAIAGPAYRFEEIGHGENALYKSMIKNIQIDEPGYAAVTAVVLDGQPDEDWKKILITACGRCENTGMQFSEDRRTVGRNWGKAPVLIESVEGVITLPSSADDTAMTCKVLNPNGTVKKQFTVNNGMIPLKAEYGTMWYLMER